MLKLNPAQIEIVTNVAKEAAAAGHGRKSELYREAAQRLGCALATLHRYIAAVTSKPERKRRSDAGAVTLPRDEAVLISALVVNGARKNGKRIMTVEHARDILIAEKRIKAEITNPATGEISILSPNAISRALRSYSLHPDQLLQPAPVTAMASLFPNHCWQIDASLCVLYYLTNNTGLQVMDAKTFYKNKPANLKSIENDRVWRYVVTDHTSGWLFVQYVFGGETSKNLCDVFIAAMQKRGLNDPVHGVPKMIMLDPGSANTSAQFDHLCDALQVKKIVNEAGNPRAKGQVENANNLVEVNFESKLSLVRVTSIEQLNAKAGDWMVYFNGKKVHGRHGMTRYAAWLTIKPEQLRAAPSVQICRELSVSAPIERVVSPSLLVSLQGEFYRVADVPGILVGAKIWLCKNPWRQDVINVITYDEQGQKQFHICEQVQQNEWGYDVDAPVIGERYQAPKHTAAQHNATEIELLVMGASTQEEAKKKRKGKALAFDGQINPFTTIETAPKQLYLPRSATPNTITAPTVQAAPWSITKASLWLANQGMTITPEMRTALLAWYPAGVPADEVATLLERLAQPFTAATTAAKPLLKVVG